MQTTCSGLICDKQHPKDWTNIRGRGWVGTSPHISNLTLLHSIWIECDNAG